MGIKTTKNDCKEGFNLNWGYAEGGISPCPEPRKGYYSLFGRVWYNYEKEYELLYYRDVYEQLSKWFEFPAFEKLLKEFKDKHPLQDSDKEKIDPDDFCCDDPIVPARKSEILFWQDKYCFPFVGSLKADHGLPKSFGINQDCKVWMEFRHGQGSYGETYAWNCTFSDFTDTAILFFQEVMDFSLGIPFILEHETETIYDINSYMKDVLVQRYANPADYGQFLDLTPSLKAGFKRILAKHKRISDQSVPANDNLYLEILNGYGKRKRSSVDVSPTDVSTMISLYEKSDPPTLVAKALLSWYNVEMNRVGPTIQLFEVAKERQRKGIGRLLYTLIETWLANDDELTSNYDKIQVTDISSEMGESFFLAMGFEYDEIEEMSKYISD